MFRTLVLEQVLKKTIILSKKNPILILTLLTLKNPILFLARFDKEDVQNIKLYSSMKNEEIQVVLEVKFSILRLLILLFFLFFFFYLIGD